MLTFLKVLAFNGLIILFFWYVGNSIPQQRKDPPKESDLTADMAPEAFVAGGRGNFLRQGHLRAVPHHRRKGRALPESGRHRRVG